jgi:hypothetical protein
MRQERDCGGPFEAGEARTVEQRRSGDLHTARNFPVFAGSIVAETFLTGSGGLSRMRSGVEMAANERVLVARALRTHDAAETDMGRGRVDRLTLARGRPVAQAVVRRAQM